MRIRPYKRADADELARLFYDSVRHLGRAAYSEAQVGAWAPDLSTGEGIDRRNGDGRLVLVAEADDGALLGYGDLEPDGHIDRLFRLPDLKHRGVGAALLNALIYQAGVNDIRRLTVEASELAKPVFLRAGFKVVGRRDFELRGVPVHNYAMERLLAP